MTKGLTTNDLTSAAWETLLRAHRDFQSGASPAYDEVLVEVSGRIRDSASIGKADIGSLLFWKRLRADMRWVRDLMAMRVLEVRFVTEKAAAAVNNTSLGLPAAASRGRAAISALPGFARGDALASALLTAAAPERMAVYDRRAQKGIGNARALTIGDARKVWTLHANRQRPVVRGEASRAQLVRPRSRRGAVLAGRSGLSPKIPQFSWRTPL
ncbi:hypothetical protein QE394_000998 [Arthrobacter sp. SORGH_AS 212]|nr:hypothetical protein [Arthrobacter sp. SORGH_AS_0212]